MPAAARAQSAEPVVVVDLRPGDADSRRQSREAFLVELGGFAGVQLPSDPALSRALAAEPAPAPGAAERKKAAQLMSQLLVRRSRDDCSGVASAREAAALLAALEAAGRPVEAEQKIAYAYMLVCAHRAGDADAARLAASLLERIGQTGPPDGIDEATWGQYTAPPTGAAAANVRVEGVPPDATIWIDHAEAGTAPLEAALLEGEHLLGAATERGVTGRWFRAGPKAESVRYDIAVPPSRWSRLRETVEAWREGEASANALAIAELMKIAGVRYAILLSEGDRAALWTLPPEAEAARRITPGRMKAPLPLANAIVTGSAPGGDGEDGDVQILREPAKKEEREPHQWWVYASIIGAVAVGASLILANDLAQDRQRIDLSWP